MFHHVYAGSMYSLYDKMHLYLWICHWASAFVALALASRLESALGALAVLASFVALALAAVASSLTSVLVS